RRRQRPRLGSCGSLLHGAFELLGFGECVGEHRLSVLLPVGEWSSVGEGNDVAAGGVHDLVDDAGQGRSEEHTSELQSRENLVCRLLLEKKKEIMNHLSDEGD